MKTRSKTYRAVKEKAATETQPLAAAIAFLKEHARSTFDETVEVHVRLGIDPGKSDQMVRGSVQYPSGVAKSRIIAVLTGDADAQKASTEAGASIVGGEELITKIQEDGTIAADILVASPDMMPKLAKVAQILGPQGLMPSPKAGTVSPNPAQIVAGLAGGTVAFKMDQQGIIHETVGKISWDAEKITDNVRALLSAIKAARPASAKGELIKSVTLASTMSPGLRISAGA